MVLIVFLHSDVECGLTMRRPGRPGAEKSCPKVRVERMENTVRYRDQAQVQAQAQAPDTDAINVRVDFLVVFFFRLWCFWRHIFFILAMGSRSSSMLSVVAQHGRTVQRRWQHERPYKKSVVSF